MFSSSLSLEEQLEAHPIRTNRQLLAFNVRSRDIQWRKLITPLQSRKLTSCRYLGNDFNYISNTSQTVNESNRREVLVCHDMMGNYLEDRHYSSSKKWDDYRFYHWSGIDYFCYFSHNYITIPPPGWINAAHLHGVKVLGTFITEGNSGTQLLLDALETRSKILQMCDSLVRLCEHFSFEGWLINIECHVPTDKIEYLIFFLDNLRYYISQRIPNGVIFWYDSVIHNGSVSWQNEINDKNVRFFKASDCMLINYTWTDNSLVKTEQIVETERSEKRKAFFGIDIFGRGQLAKFQTDKTLERIVQSNFSIGIFAPAWTFESLQHFGYDIRTFDGRFNINEAFLNRNEKFWWRLWKYFATHPYTDLPFFTDFCLGSGVKTFNYGREVNKRFFSLCRQSLQPSVPLHDFVERNYLDAVNGGSSLKILKYDLSFRIFCTDFIVDRALIFAYAYKMADSSVGEIDLILRFCENDDDKKDCYLMCGDYNDSLNLQKGRCYLSPLKKEDYLNLSRIMSEKRSEIKLPFNLDNNWIVRYYGVSFDRAINVKDIGVLFRRNSESYRSPVANLGAVYFNSFEISSDFNRMTNWANISVEHVLND